MSEKYRNVVRCRGCGQFRKLDCVLRPAKNQIYFDVVTTQHKFEKCETEFGKFAELVEK